MKTSFCALLLLVASAAALPSYAGTLICARDRVSTADQHRLETAAQEAFGSLDVDSDGSSYCWNRRRALAWLATERVAQPDGSLRWASASCRREARRWACERDDHRSMRVRVEIAGGPHERTVTIPLEMKIDAARTLVERGFELLKTSITAEQSCSRFGNAARSYGELREAFFREDDDTELSLSKEDDGSLSFAQSTMYLRFEPVPGGDRDNEYEYRCWSFWIVVA